MSRLLGSGVAPGISFPLQRPDRTLFMDGPGLWDEFLDEFALPGADLHAGYWPQRSGNVLGGEELGIWPHSNRVVYQDDYPWSGSRGYPFFIRGICRDNVGAPVSNAITRLFRSFDDLLLAQGVSGGDGAYGFGAFDQTTLCYVNAYRTPPAIAGSTVRTLVGQPL